MAWKGTITSVDASTGVLQVNVSFTDDADGSFERVFGVNHETDDVTALIRAEIDRLEATDTLRSNLAGMVGQEITKE